MKNVASFIWLSCMIILKCSIICILRTFFFFFFFQTGRSSENSFVCTWCHSMKLLFQVVGDHLFVSSVSFCASSVESVPASKQTIHEQPEATLSQGKKRQNLCISVTL